MRILICLFFLFFVQATYAYNVPVNADTSKKHILDDLAIRPAYYSEYRINKNSFYSRYGFNNDAKRIIDYFFAKQKKYALLICLPTAVSVLLSFVLVFSFSTSVLFALIALAVVLLYTIAWVFRIVGIINLINHKKINLLNQLIEYRKTGIYNLENKKTTKKRVNYNEDFYYEKK